MRHVLIDGVKIMIWFMFIYFLGRLAGVGSRLTQNSTQKCTKSFTGEAYEFTLFEVYLRHQLNQGATERL